MTFTPSFSHIRGSSSVVNWSARAYTPPFYLLLIAGQSQRGSLCELGDRGEHEVLHGTHEQWEDQHDNRDILSRRYSVLLYNCVYFRSGSVCVCVCARERERSARVCVCVCVCVWCECITRLAPLVPAAQRSLRPAESTAFDSQAVQEPLSTVCD
jgi:hypothetical protein